MRIDLQKKNSVMILLFCIISLFVLSCKGSSSSTSSGSSFWILDFYPKDKSSLSPSDIEIYVVVDFNPVSENIKFSVWKEGEPVAGRILTEKQSKSYRIKYELIERGEGTYLVYFNYGDRATFWTFFAETTRIIPNFDKFSVPRDGYKNFPYGSSIIISEENLLNFWTIDDETVVLKKKFLFESFDVSYDISFVPNSILVNILDYESSKNYQLDVTGVIFLEGNPEFAHTKLNFRSVDTSRPFVKTCSPDFCIRQGSCSQIDSLSSFDIIFGDDEEIDPISVSENFIVELNGSRVIFGEIWSVYETQSLVSKNPAGTAKLYVFPNRIYFDFGSQVDNSNISIYILPKLSDTSGNSIDSFFSWCINVL
ncbi:MAG: hypothetical protein NZ927_00380 [Candidatus Calescibacterium sp.]|nr:hypothetical protein [Candidatus Calescibacterium sp.]